MIYRKLTDTGDYTFGKGAGNFLSNSPATVGQAIQTALQLMQGEWFIDTSAGVPFDTRILGTGTKAMYDIAIQSAILAVQGVVGIVKYLSSIDAATRNVTIACTVDTIYGAAFVSVNLKPFEYSPPV